jgi:thymidylate kinase
MSASRSHEPQIIVVEGLDGVGKSTVTRALVELTGGVDVTKAIMESMGASRKTIVDSRSVYARFHYWLAVNYLAGEYARTSIRTNRMAVIDSYFFRTIASHEALGAQVDRFQLLSKAVRPDRAVLLTVSEEVRSARLRARDSDSSQPAWHVDLDDRWSQVLSIYRDFGLTEVDTSTTPSRAAEQILESSTAKQFKFAI